MRLNFLFIPLFSLFIILSAVLFNSFSSTVYSTQFKELNVYREFQNDIIKVNKLSSNIIDYIKGTINSLESDLFTEREIKHMQDVRNIFTKLKIIYIILGILITIYLIFADKITRLNLLFYGGLTALLLLALMSAILLNFNVSFTKFHELAFSNNLWMLDYTSNLIKLFPQEFFVNIFKNILKDSLIISLLAVLYGYNVRKYFNSKKIT